jgi:DNA-binding response OmpR family regulator
MKLTKSARILIVDYESNIRLMVRTALTSDGYQVDEAVNGREALLAIERGTADVMILDLSMPVLDGMGVLEELRSIAPEHKPRVIVLTAYGSISAAVKATRLGAVDFLEKPVSPAELREAVELAMDDSFAPPAPGHGSPGDPLAGGYGAVLDRVRKALRLTHVEDAETLLMKAADLGEKDARYFNLLGVLYETQRKWKLARKFYGKAIRSDKAYEPAQQNMRRLYELNEFGRSREALLLGDESTLELAQIQLQRQQGR